ncbi:MAG: ATP-dependent Clp protease adaptor ClpS [Muribaculaceae bacterium]|nr:ATP-dependent Clp protease adaptor ClpS [Muribaculaceae bacterium]
MGQQQFSVKERTGLCIDEPKEYTVIIHNDDFTTMEFVVDLLRSVFYKDYLSAYAIMMDVHKKGKGVVGRYSYDMAVTKRDRALSLAREEGFPLKVTVEEA